MKTIFKIFFTCVYLLIIMFSAKAQVKYLSDEIISSLSMEDIAELENAEKIKLQGDALMAEAVLIEEHHGISMMKIEDYEADKIRGMDNETLEVVRQAARKKIQASNYYGNWNLIISSIYTKRLKQLLIEASKSDKKSMNSLMEKNGLLMKTSGLIRREALQMNNELLVYPYLMDAHVIESMAINELKKAFLLIYTDAIINESNRVAVLNNRNTKNKGALYFKIQVAASKKILSSEQAKLLVVDNMAISNEYDNGWYKYSVSENFKSYEDAFEYKQSLRIRGAFILAFVDGEKVHISEAINFQNNKGVKRNVKRKSKSVYRLRIGISTQPLSDARLNEMKSGGKPIVIVDYGGWFTYTVGDFNSKRDAINFKKNKALSNAIVVEYKNGRSIENN